MEKKKYIAPRTSTVRLLAMNHLTSGSIKPVNETNSMFSREQNVWDDEDEETENSIWK